ncbi:sulfotransferase domain-containing protein [Sphingomonas sp. RB56-2]|uniref:Sulfotransferase domain-containing protein n=1 Tax=Sphingomonas brevis TaxID=2908206 RepID=A0ABT0S9U4_9SPHN|nr:sulfotransferase domain-containing protein [Sphingomonas brevis]MCL6741176.1 sulfotransferase domain-containing protein [Sphingomonas brevis]
MTSRQAPGPRHNQRTGVWMFHTLRTRGDMDFDDISRVVPWIETSQLVGVDLNAPQRASPRGFKSHLSYDTIPKGARYVVSLRDPKDAFVSMYHFMVGFMIEPGAISLEDFFEAWVLGGGPGGEGYWRHLKSWWAVRHEPNVLLLSYADLVRDRAACIKRMADFAGIALDDVLLDLTLERTSRAYMLEHVDHFDVALLPQMAAGRMLGNDRAQVRPGTDGDHKSEIPASVAERIDAIWEKEIAIPLGIADFKSLEAML